VSTEENKTLIRRVYAEVFNEGRLEVVNGLIGADVVNQPARSAAPDGPAAVRQLAARLRSAFPDPP
jgi:hypothetical protein